MSRDIHTVELLTQVFPFDSSMKLDIIKEGSVSLSATKSEMPNTRCKIITDQMASLFTAEIRRCCWSTRHRLGPANLLPHWQTFKKKRELHCKWPIFWLCIFKCLLCECSVRCEQRKAETFVRYVSAEIWYDENVSVRLCLHIFYGLAETYSFFTFQLKHTHFWVSIIQFTCMFQLYILLHLCFKRNIFRWVTNW